MIGSLSGSGVDLYQLTLDSIPDRLDFGLVMQGPDAGASSTLQLLDGSGQVLGTWKAGSLGTSTIQVNLEGLSPGSTLYLGLSAGGSQPATISFGWLTSRRYSSTSATIASPFQTGLPLAVLCRC